MTLTELDPDTRKSEDSTTAELETEKQKREDSGDVESLSVTSIDDSQTNSDVESTEKVRKRNSKTWLALKCVIFLACLVLILLAVIFIGAEVERRQVMLASETTWVYETPKVCGAALGETDVMQAQNSSFTTFINSEEAFEGEAPVAHCGECGHCSTEDDIGILKDTTETLTSDTTDCSKRGILFGREAVESCMKRNVGFTSNCNDCWVDNIMCDLRKCTFTCIKSVFLYRESNNVDGTHTLNPCLQCDEKLCGPAFIQCAGANRRRIGVISDINRSEDVEVCKKVDKAWMMRISSPHNT